MHRRVKGRPLLLEQVTQVSSSQTLMFFSLHRNSTYSLKFAHVIAGLEPFNFHMTITQENNNRLP